MYITKHSALGGTGADQSFEESVSNLAHEFLSDKAPSLMKDELGFQLLDKSDDDNKGVGVCVFKPNGVLMFAPIFFLNGEIKGHELLFLPDQDLFIPLKEPWINEIIGKKPALVGDPVDKNFQRTHGGIQPDLSVFRTPPTKFAAYLNYNILQQEPEFLPKLKKFISKTGVEFNKTASLMLDSLNEVLNATNLRKFFKYASSKSLNKLNNVINGSLLTKKAFEKMYPNVKLESYTKYRTKKARSKELLRNDSPNWRDEFFNNPKKAGYVSIISYSATITSGSPFHLTEDEKEKLAKQQYLVVDNRSDKQVAKVAMEGPQTFTTPVDSGVYSVLMADGTFKDLVIIRRVQMDNQWLVGDKDCDFLVCEPGSNTAMPAAGKNIFCKEKYPKEKFKKWYNSLPDATNFSFLKNHSILNFINENGSCYGDVQGHITRFGDVIRIKSGKTDVEIGDKWTSVLKKRGDSLYVPKDCKVFAAECSCPCCLSESGEPLMFGRPEIIKAAEAKTHQTIKLSTAHDWCIINGKQYPTKYAGFCSLIKDYNLREKDAKALFKQADANSAGYHVASIFVKKADIPLNPEANKRPESDMYFPEPLENDSGAVFGDMVPVAPGNFQTVQTSEQYLAPNSGPYENTLNPPYPADDMVMVQQALQNGQEEVFNLSVLKQFLNDGDLSSEIDEEIPELIRGMNHAGRMLFRYYWKGEKFKELYGPQEMPELESSLRKVFELLGDIVLLLKHRLKKDDTYGELSKINLADLNE